MVRPEHVRLPDPGKPEVYVDLDGVVVDFYRGACKLFGYCPEEAPREALRRCDLAWLTGSEVGDVAGTRQFWKRVEGIGPSFWEELPPYQGAVDFVQDILELVGLRNFSFCTSPTRWLTSTADGKMAWINAFAGAFGEKELRMILTPEKHGASGPGRILLDDNLPNCQDFVRRFEEATAISMQAPWNPSGLSYDRALETLRLIINTPAARGHVYGLPMEGSE